MLSCDPIQATVPLESDFSWKAAYVSLVGALSLCFCIEKPWIAVDYPWISFVFSALSHGSPKMSAKLILVFLESKTFWGIFASGNAAL